MFRGEHDCESADKCVFASSSASATLIVVDELRKELISQDQPATLRDEGGCYHPLVTLPGGKFVVAMWEAVSGSAKLTHLCN